MSQSATHKHFTMADLEWMIMPPVLLKQFKIYRADGKPVGLALWAYLNEESEKRLAENLKSGTPVRLRPDEWKSGDRAWLIELIVLGTGEARKVITQKVLSDLKSDVLAKEKFKLAVSGLV